MEGKELQVQKLIDNYKKSIIQSEAEVRSKLIVPFLQQLGYPDELRAEEFPVYGYAGRERLNPKPADFIMFSDHTFAQHRKRRQRDIEWVQDHSLIVVEAKAPGKLGNDTLGQAQYYTAWTKAAAYAVTDGEVFHGYYYKKLTSDLSIIKCRVEDLPNQDLDAFSYSNVLAVKEKACDSSEKALPEDIQYLRADDKLDLPKETLRMMRESLGKNAENLTEVELVSLFLNTTNFYLNNNIRYGIPDYMFGIPRSIQAASLYIENDMTPAFVGTVDKYAWENIDRYEFTSESFDLVIMLVDREPMEYAFAVHAFVESAKKRLETLSNIKRMSEADNIYLISNDTIRIPIGTADEKCFDSILPAIDIWMDSLHKLREIEEYYDIEFKLEHIEGGKSLESFYNDLEFVYAGTKTEQNTIVEGLEPEWLSKVDYDIETTIDLGIIPEKKRSKITLHGITFETYKIYLVPGKIKKKGQNIFVPMSCECRIVATS